MPVGPLEVARQPVGLERRQASDHDNDRPVGPGRVLHGRAKFTQVLSLPSASTLSSVRTTPVERLWASSMSSASDSSTPGDVLAWARSFRVRWTSPPTPRTLARTTASVNRMRAPSGCSPRSRLSASSATCKCW